MLRFANVSINMSPNGISVDVGGGHRTPSQTPLTPTRARRSGTTTSATDRTGPQGGINASGPARATPLPSPRPSRNEVPIMLQPSTPRQGALRRTPMTPLRSPQLGQHRAMTTAPQARSYGAPTSVPYVPQCGPLRPVHPLYDDEEVPRVRTLDRRTGPHGFYVVFTGLRPGIYHEYWYALFYFLLNLQMLNFSTGML